MRMDKGQKFTRETVGGFFAGAVGTYTVLRYKKDGVLVAMCHSVANCPGGDADLVGREHHFTPYQQTNNNITTLIQGE